MRKNSQLIGVFDSSNAVTSSSEINELVGL